MMLPATELEENLRSTRHKETFDAVEEIQNLAIRSKIHITNRIGVTHQSIVEKLNNSQAQWPRRC